jgi:hypothetical protein
MMTHFNVCSVILLLEKGFFAVVLDVLVIVSELMIYHLSVFDTNGFPICYGCRNAERSIAITFIGRLPLFSFILLTLLVILMLKN